MNGDPYRTPQPSDRRVINRSGAASAAAGQAHRQQDEPKASPSAEPRSYGLVSSSNGSGDSKKKKGYKVTAVLITLVVLILAAAGYIAFTSLKADAPGIDSSKYQAVSFTDGQLYFGKLSSVNSEYLKLTDVYYLQPQSGDESTGSLQNASSNQNNFKLIKFTDVIYGPEDEMIIPKSQVLFYENIQKDGKVTKLIEQQKGK